MGVTLSYSSAPSKVEAIADTSGSILDANSRRGYCGVFNAGTKYAYLGLGSAAKTSGIPVPPGGAYEFTQHINPCVGELFAICASGESTNLNIIESTI